MGKKKEVKVWGEDQLKVLKENISPLEVKNRIGNDFSLEEIVRKRLELIKIKDVNQYSREKLASLHKLSKFGCHPESPRYKSFFDSLPSEVAVLRTKKIVCPARVWKMSIEDVFRLNSMRRQPKDIEACVKFFNSLHEQESTLNYEGNSGELNKIKVMKKREAQRLFHLGLQTSFKTNKGLTNANKKLQLWESLKKYPMYHEKRLFRVAEVTLDNILELNSLCGSKAKTKEECIKIFNSLPYLENGKMMYSNGVVPQETSVETQKQKETSAVKVFLKGDFHNTFSIPIYTKGKEYFESLPKEKINRKFMKQTVTLGTLKDFIKLDSFRKHPHSLEECESYFGSLFTLEEYLKRAEENKSSKVVLKNKVQITEKIKNSPKKNKSYLYIAALGLLAIAVLGVILFLMR